MPSNSINGDWKGNTLQSQFKLFLRAMKPVLFSIALAASLAAASSNNPPPPYTPPMVTAAANQQWADAAKAVQVGKFADAATILEPLSKKYWDTQLGDKSTSLLIECYLQTKNPKKAQALAKRFLEGKPASIYRDRVESALALVKIQDYNVFGGVEDLSRIFSYSKSPAIRTRAKEALLQVLASSSLSAEELITLIDLAPNDRDIMSYAYFQLGREHQSEGRWKSARYQYAKALQINPGTPVADAASQGLKALADRGNGLPTVLVLAPLSGDFADFGSRMVEGVVLAHEEYVTKNGKKVLLRIVDDRADPVRATHRVQEILAQEEVAGIIGPMMSPAATAIGAWLSKTYPEIPMITPTATDEGIASLGQNVFQLNVPTATLARSIARYALTCLNAREFAIFSPLSEYGRIMSEEFTREVEAGGGHVYAQQSYQEGAPDFQTEFSRVRLRKMNLDNRRRNLNKANENLDNWPGKERKEYFEDSLITFDAIFIPSADPADAAAMASHTAFNKLGGKLLGSSGWYGRPLLSDGKHIVENSYFSVPFAENESDSEYTKFVKAFSNRWQGQQPDKERISGLSYDAMRILLDSWTKAQGKGVAASILSQKNFPGVFGGYAFDSTGANSAQHILTVQKGKFALSDSCPEPVVEKKKGPGKW